MLGKAVYKRPLPWPPPWDGVVATLLLCLSAWFGLHAVVWLDVIDLTFDGWVFLATGWIMVGVAIAALIRWIRDERNPQWDGVANRRNGPPGRRATDAVVDSKAS
jgi:hypothetical protein